MSVHPDKTAWRAVDACGGTYTPEEHASRYAEGHAAALDAALEAVKKPDALMAELLEALRSVESLFVRELNPSNYDHDQVCEMNRNFAEAVGIAQADIAKVATSQDALAVQVQA